MMKVEIRWQDRLEPPGKDSFHAYLKRIKETNTPTAMETVFKMWLKEKVLGKRVLVSDLEFYVDERMIELKREEESAFFKRIGEAANK